MDDDERDQAMALWEVVTDLVILLKEQERADGALEESYWRGVADGIAAAMTGDPTMLKL